MSIKRSLAFYPDILEWLGEQRSSVRILRKERHAMEKGFIAYAKMFVAYVRSSSARKKEVEPAAPQPAKVDAASRALEQFYDSEEILKRMKWKRVTWDDEADYASFSKRILDNDAMFKRMPAFSFLSIHVVKDPCISDFVVLPPLEKKIAAGALTNWLLQEREPKTVGAYTPSPASERRGAFHVDWTSGAVKILDTASAQETLTFLTTVAPRLQAVQLLMEEQQTRQTADITKVNIRVGATLKFNAFDTSFWDDPKRKTSADFVNPDELEKFLSGLLKSPLLYRRFLKGQHIRVMPPGRPYYADMEKKEIQIPADFADFNWLKAHQRFESIEKVCDTGRRMKWVWFCIGITLVGDFDLP
ncbi:hypothetical protein NESM_000751000 [Novymonas esmeraldas]|uniref:Uncharacterized protein n=1 Tax=Novymonas esmeraldas TaxID=1808958 RepID=A0AAW0EXU9_9TRYP